MDTTPSAVPEVCVVGGLGPCAFVGVATPLGASAGAGDAMLKDQLGELLVRAGRRAEAWIEILIEHETGTNLVEARWRGNRERSR